MGQNALSNARIFSLMNILVRDLWGNGLCHKFRAGSMRTNQVNHCDLSFEYDSTKNEEK